MPPRTRVDRDITQRDVAKLASVDALAAWLTAMDYPTDCRKAQPVSAFGLSPDTTDAIRHMELLAEDDEGFFRVLFVQLRSLTAKARTELARNMGNRTADHLLILTRDFDALEFVLVDKQTRKHRGPGGGATVQTIPRTVTVERKSADTVRLRTLRRLTWTGKDALAQFDKLRSVFESAHFSEQYFQNRALFADHFLTARLREDEAWRDNPTDAYAGVKEIMRDARPRLSHESEETVRAQLFEPLWKLLGFKATVNKPADKDHLEPDYLLSDSDGNVATVAFVYRWDRWLDGPDPSDDDTPEENPGAAVVSALNRDDIRWAIVTNGKYWRLYSKQAHSRATNFYEIDLEEALESAAETDPNEAFRYWWLFFRREAFADLPGKEQPTCWLDAIVQGSRDYAKRLGDRLKKRIFEEVFPHIAEGFLADRKKRLGQKGKPDDDELRETFEATLTLLYRLLFLLFAESRDLLPLNEHAYGQASLANIKKEIADKAGIAELQVAEKLKPYSPTDTTIYDRLLKLFEVMDKGDPILNVPCYNGGLFQTEPDDEPASREHRIAAYLLEHKVPDRFLALAIDRLARDPDEKTLGLVFIDYKSLEVRHLGSIYEGLLEFKLKIAEEDLTTKVEKKREKFIPLSEAKRGKRKKSDPTPVVHKGEVYLSNDKAERKATGSYYTPDPIVEYIVEHTVGPVLDEKLEALKPQLDKAGKTFHRHLTNAKNNPGLLPDDTDPREFAGAKTYAEHSDLVEKVFDMKVLDPAMGSGHFLVEAVDFITDRLLDFLNRYPNNPVGHMLARTRQNILDSLGQQGVTVDPVKLTDVNLLKRHVLKRCIYGVDLNPMAVELAKVSLWLDAFTLGAPLSFLDHHLRCGNSLIGATVDDLKKATEGQLFALDYQPLLRAIDRVMLVNRMADATAAEVHKSADEYAQAREQLSGYKIVLDLPVADHFVDSDAKGKEKSKKSRERTSAGRKPSSLLTHADDLDMTSREAFLASLRDDDERELVARVEDTADRPDLRFFHWEIEFPEVFFGFVDADQRQIRHRNDIAEGSAGFDAVVGNPPYVRQETILPLKHFLRSAFSTFDSVNDLYVYFQEQEVLNLRAHGRMGMIVSNKWLRAGYGRKLRSFLRRHAQPLEVIDFGHAPIFPEADTFPCIPIVARRGRAIPDKSNVPETEEVIVCSVLSDHWSSRLDLASYFQSRRYSIPTQQLSDDGWSLEHPTVNALLRKICEGGIPLKDYSRSRALLGIKTGLNECFVIGKATADALRRSDDRLDGILTPVLRGREVDRWNARTGASWLIQLPSSENKTWPWSDCDGHEAERVFRQTYPALYDHLVGFKEQLQRRCDQGRFWWELRSWQYYDQLSQPKVLWQDISTYSLFAWDDRRSAVLNTVYFLPTDQREVLAVLASPLGWWLMQRTFPKALNDAVRTFGEHIDLFPMPILSTRTVEQMQLTIEDARCSVAQIQNLLLDFAHQLSRQGIEGIEKMLSSVLAMSAEHFVRVESIRSWRPSTSQQGDRVQRICEHVGDRVHELLTGLSRSERALATLVEDAYRLTPEERNLLRTTRTARDPIDVLESKLGAPVG